MHWIGTWRNQYGSTVRITNDRDHRVVGVFVTALKDSGFHGQEVPVIGVHQGDCISFSFGGAGPAGDTVASFTGLLREGKLQTLWHVVADSALKAQAAGAPGKLVKLNWEHAVLTSADTFERIA